MTKSGRYESSTGRPLRAVTRMSTFPTTWEEKKKRSVDLTVATDAALDRFRALPGAAAGSPSGRISRGAAISTILGAVLRLSADEARMMRLATMNVLGEIGASARDENKVDDEMREIADSFSRVSDLAKLFDILSDGAAESR